ncbi:hypothetical protein QQF64_022201 [Cirrhinus molitorella]|uniref:Uncharacterized protein n=1 Tax=Cirrhinus molitorella TaxID=172907 RepID=A0ABR3LBG6_9TELE
MYLTTQHDTSDTFDLSNISDIIADLHTNPINQTLLRQVREAKRGEEHWLNHPDPPHLYANNMWWRMINHTAKMNGLSECYLCAQLPHSITGGDWWLYQNPDPEVMKGLATIAVAVTSLPEEDDLWIAEDEGKWSTVKSVKRVAGRVATVKETPRNLTCYQSIEGQVYLGNIPPTHCRELFMTNSRNDDTRNRCMSCLLNITFVHHGTTQSLVSGHYLSSAHVHEQNRCHDACNMTHISDNKGTSVLEDWYWGTSLLRYWVGTCAMVELYGGALVAKLPEHLHNNTGKHLTRTKRVTDKMQDRVGQSTWMRDSYTPREHRLWNGAEKFFHAVIPALGVSLLQIEVEITRYELISFMNTTKVMMEGIKEEQRGLRLTAQQN